MERSFWLDLAARGLRMPIGADLILHERSDPKAVVYDGERLGEVIVEAARRFRTPLALALMDLTVEKASLLAALGLAAHDVDTWHFEQPPSDEQTARILEGLEGPLDSRAKAGVEAVAFAARQSGLVAVGMCIGPFSLMTKLLADPITAVYLAGAGETAETESEVAAVERCLELSLAAVLRSVRAQVNAGAKAIMLAEPAASTAYISPMQLEAGADLLERYVLGPCRRVRALLNELGADLLFHCCGELTPDFVRGFASLDPAVLSLGSSRRLWEDASLVPRSTVLFGNLPSKRFYSDELVSVADVEAMARDLIQRMREANHPFILGSECDVLSVAGSEQTIRRKVAAMLECG